MICVLDPVHPNFSRIPSLKKPNVPITSIGPFSVMLQGSEIVEKRSFNIFLFNLIFIF